MIDINTYKNIFGTNTRTDCMKSKITIQSSDRELKKETIIPTIITKGTINPNQGYFQPKPITTKDIGNNNHCIM